MSEVYKLRPRTPIFVNTIEKIFLEKYVNVIYF